MNFIRILSYVVAFVTLGACGPQTIEVEDSNHVAGGQVDFVIDWNLEAFDAVFRDGCELLEDTPEGVEECIQDKINKVLDILEGIEEEETVEE
jgi:hypothetical protein